MLRYRQIHAALPGIACVAYGGTVVCRNGVAADHDDAKVRGHMEGRLVDITADLGLGDGEAAMLTTSLSPAYIAENQETS